MRILLITHFFPPKHTAGTENYTLGLALTFQSRGHDVQVLCAEDWDTGNLYWNGVTEDIYRGVRVIRIHLNWNLADNPNRILYDSEPVNNWISNFLIRESFDIVHVTSLSSLGVGVLKCVKAAEIPLILTLMDFWFICPSIQLVRSNGEICDGETTALQCQSCLMANSGISQRLSTLGLSSEFQSLLWGPLSQLPVITKQRGFRGYLLNMFDRKNLLKEALELPNVVLSHSKIVRDTHSSHVKRSIEILQNGHELSWVKPTRKKQRDNHLNIGYMGQIIPVKGVHMLIEAYKKAKLDGRTALSIWGRVDKDIEYIQKLKEIIDNDPSISLLGYIKRDELAGVFSSIDVLVVPSMWLENAPLVIHEAFAAQTPVIATNIGGMSEAVTDEVNGLLFKHGDVDDLARQLQRLIAEPGLLEKLKAGIPNVKTIEDEVEELEKLYLDLL